MKYKLWGAAACLASVAVILLLLLLTEEDHQRVHQHMEAVPTQVCSHSDDTFCTHLPLLEIDTGGAEIPGEFLLSEGDSPLLDPVTGAWLTSTAENGANSILASLSVVDHTGTNNHISDDPTLQSLISIRIRGNSSRLFDKKGYLLQLTTEDGLNAPAELLGMSSHHEWALHGPFLDKTLLRNYLFYNLAGEIMDYAPNVRFCELILNGNYMGVYLLTETITAGQDGSRLDITVSEKNNNFSSYILRVDRGSSNPTANIDPFTRYTLITSTKFNIEYPKAKDLTEEMALRIERDFSSFEKALYSYDYDTDDFGYTEYIDTESFVDYFILNELTCNYDAAAFSTYVYQGLDGKYRMCVWDFNNACDNYQETAFLPEGFKLQERLWYFMLMKDEDFVEAVIDRYAELRESFLSEEYLLNYIDETVAYLGPAVDRNFEKWGYTFHHSANLLIPSQRNPSSYEDAVNQLKTFLQARVLWMDENIDVLRQYCADSAVKAYNENNK